MSDENTGAVLFEKDQLKPADYNVIKDLKPGEISEPFESVDNEGNLGHTVYKIIKIDKIIPAHPASFKEDFSILLNIAKESNSRKAIDEFITKKQRTTYIVIDPMFHNCPFKREGWIK